MEFFGELYHRYIPLLYGVCLKYLQDEDKSHDAVMQLFEDLVPKISNYEIKEFRTWLHTVVKNHCLQILRKDNKEIRVDFNTQFVESEEILHLLCEEDNPEEQLKALRHCINRLPDGQRISILHFFMGAMSYADIADKTGYSLRAVKSNIQNGKRNLKICIDKHSS